VQGPSSPILIAGDDDQALYSQLRQSNWEHIRSLYNAGEFEVFQRFVADLIPEIPVEEIEEARTHNHPALLVIASRPYRTQIVEYLERQGITVDTKRDAETRLARESRSQDPKDLSEDKHRVANRPRLGAGNCRLSCDQALRTN